MHEVFLSFSNDCNVLVLSTELADNTVIARRLNENPAILTEDMFSWKSQIISS